MEGNTRRRKYVGVGGDDVPSLGILEGEILRILWGAGVPQSSVQVYDAMYMERRANSIEMQSPSTIAVTLSRMVEKGLLKIERRIGAGKGYYSPLKKQADVVAAVLDDVSIRLTGSSLGTLLAAACNAPDPNNQIESVAATLRELKNRE